MPDVNGFGVPLTVSGFRGSRAAPPTVRGKAHTFSDSSPSLPPPYPPYNVADVVTRVQGAAVRCYLSEMVYVPFLAVDSFGSPVRGLQSLTDTRVILFSSGRDVAPTSGGGALVVTPLSGDIVEINPTLLPGAYAYKLATTYTGTVGFVRVRVSNPRIRDIVVTVQVDERPTVSGEGGSVDLTELTRLQNQVLQDTGILKQDFTKSQLTLIDIQTVIGGLSVDLDAAVAALGQIPTKIDDLGNTLLGRWKILVDEAVLLYLTPGASPTILKAYKLYDETGTLNARKVFKRVPMTPQEIQSEGVGWNLS